VADDAEQAEQAAQPPRSDADLALVGATTARSTVSDVVVVKPAGDAALAAGAGAGPGAEGLFLRLENVGIHGGDASDMWNVYVAVGGGDRSLVGTIAPFGLAGLTARGGSQTLTFDISELAADVGSEDAAVTVSFESVKEPPEHRPFWDRTALYVSSA
jgi:hypothetical protein